MEYQLTRNFVFDVHLDNVNHPGKVEKSFNTNCIFGFPKWTLGVWAQWGAKGHIE